MKTSLVWFRNDLRVHDNEALYRAAEYDRVLPVYCFDPRQFGKTSFGFKKTGPHRTRFLIESVLNLRENLQKSGGTLLIRIGKPEEIVPQLVEKYKIDTLFYHSEDA